MDLSACYSSRYSYWIPTVVLCMGLVVIAPRLGGQNQEKSEAQPPPSALITDG